MSVLTEATRRNIPEVGILIVNAVNTSNLTYAFIYYGCLITDQNMYRLVIFTNIRGFDGKPQNFRTITGALNQNVVSLQFRDKL
jgi:hypothetical protein